ncbi:CpsD/CapB family tyrosine-protein kinase [Neobacillus sp. NPDC058068]|uniref:CpsD/CapB family tyrosine-protein kinase n=1 Tax=Neobacillus sp. NPDC058068 TaxID=3346325 RepID=UPI0036D8D0E5
MKRLSRKVKNNAKRSVNLIAQYNPKSPITEQYRLIRNNLHFSSVDKEIKTIVVTSPEPADGKTTTAANLAIVLAQQGKQVLLVDADLRKPSVHFTFNVSNIDGLTSILTKVIDIETAITKTYVPNLDLLTSGPIPPNPSELLGSKTMEQIIKVLKEAYEYIVFDTPPLLVVTDAQIMASKSDGVVMVVASGKTKKDRGSKAKELLEKANSQILGVVVNGVDSKKDHYYGQYG